MCHQLFRYRLARGKCDLVWLLNLQGFQVTRTSAKNYVECFEYLTLGRFMGDFNAELSRTSEYTDMNLKLKLSNQINI